MPKFGKKTVKELEAAAERRPKASPPDLSALKKQYLERLPPMFPFQRAGLYPAISDPVEDYSTPAKPQT